MRLKVRIIRMNDELSALFVDEQSDPHFGSFKASNGVKVCSHDYPEWTFNIIFLRGKGSPSDTRPVLIPNEDVPRIVTALKEFIEERCEDTTTATQDVIVLEGGAA